MPHFQIHIEEPEEIIPRLGKGQLHWKKGRSAYELASAWMSAGSFPSKVRRVLNTIEEWQEAELLEGIFERETDLRTRGRPSQTDLLCVVALPWGNAILGIEGKVDESFGPLVSDWLGEDEFGGRIARLTALCANFDIDPNSVGGLYYQLFHRTCAVIYEAQRFRYSHAIMLVHSFSALGAWFDDFAKFARIVGMPVESPNTVSASRICAGVNLRLGWVSDLPQISEAQLSSASE